METRIISELRSRDVLLARGYLREDVREDMQHLAAQGTPGDLTIERTAWRRRRTHPR